MHHPIIPEWFPEHPPIYDIEKSYAENAQDGPFFDGHIPKRPPVLGTLDFLGHSLSSPLGVPAGPLLNSRWVAFAAQVGFDLVTYKTIRSFAHPGHELPNMIFVETLQEGARSLEEPPQNLDQLTLTNSFGMPSKSPEFLLEDIDRGNRSLSKGQVMIVSVVGTPNQGVSFREDFVRAALLAKEGGAKIIEANFSCPNVGKSEGMLYLDHEAVYEYTKAIASAIHPIPLILKVGSFPSSDVLKKVFVAAARGGAAAICGLNSVSMHVVDRKGHPALGTHRPTSGVCGAAIRQAGLHFVADASSLIEKEKLDLILLGCGGIVKPEHFDDFLENGADIAMVATGMMWDPFLALRYHWKKTNELTDSRSLSF
jgi:dihydroorotate dehydrogenase